MSFSVRMTARAYADIDEVLSWIAPRAPRAAARWHAKLLKAVETLEIHPERCPVAPEAATLGLDLRQLLFGKRRRAFRILFCISNDTVTVLHIRRGARDWLKPGDIQSP